MSPAHEFDGPLNCLPVGRLFDHRGHLGGVCCHRQLDCPFQHRNRGIGILQVTEAHAKSEPAGVFLLAGLSIENNQNRVGSHQCWMQSDEFERLLLIHYVKALAVQVLGKYG